MRVAVYPGSFDPLTNGHLDILERGSRLFDQLVIAILNNSQKRPLFSLSERIEMIREVTGNLPNVTIEHFDGLLVNLIPATVLRGLRSVGDYEVELQMATLNRQLRPEHETVLLLASPANAAVSSRIVKEISSLGGDVSALVPPSVAARLKHKFDPR